MITVNKANPTPGEITSSLTGSTGDGAGLHFDGAAGNIDIASPPDLGTKFSFEFVIKADSTGTSGKIVDFGDGGRFVIEHNTTGLQVKPSNAGGWVTLQSPSPLADLEVHHLVLTVDGTTATLYDNGNQVATDTISATDIDSCTDAKIGSYYDSATDLFAGTIYRCRFWNKVVDAKALFERADVDYSSQYGSQTNKFASPDTNWGTNAADATAFNAAYAWTSYQTSTISVSSNVVTFTTAADGRGIFANYSLTAGNRYRVTMATGAISGATYQLMTRTGSDYTSIGTLVASTTNVFDFTAPAGAYSGYLYLYQSGSGSGSIALTAASVTNELVQIGCVSDYDLAYAQPALSTLIQDRSGAADGVASSTGVTQVQPITQLNSTSARIGSTQLAAGTSPYIPADGEIISSGKISANAKVNINSNGTLDWGNSADYGVLTWGGTTDAIVRGAASKNLKLGANNQNFVTIDTSGNVGVACDPANPLQVEKASSATSISNAQNDNALKLSNYSTTADGQFVSLGLSVAGNSGASSGDSVIAGFRDGDGASSLRFYTENVNTLGERMRIDSTGNVMLGSGTPASLVSDGASPVLSIGSTAGNLPSGHKAGAISFITSDVSYTGTYSDGICGEITSVSDSATGAAYGLAFHTGTTTSSNRAERMRISSTGKVGIGVSPSSLLHVSGDSNSNGGELTLQVNNNNTTDNIGTINFGNNVESSLSMIQSSTSGNNTTSDLSFHTSATGTQAPRLTIDSDGLCTFSNGINLGNTASAEATTLDGYDEGTFQVTNAEDATGVLTSETGEYTRIGNCVFIRIVIRVGTTFTDNKIAGLPFGCVTDGTTSTWSPIGTALTNSAANAPILVTARNGEANLYFYKQAVALTANKHLPSSTSEDYYRVTGYYYTTDAF